MILYICTKFHENILNSFKVIEKTQFHSQKLQMGIISKNMYMELHFLSSAYHLMMLYSCTKFCGSILNGFKIIQQKPFPYFKYKGALLHKKGGVIVIAPRILPDDALNLYQDLRKYLEQF